MEYHLPVMLQECLNGLAIEGNGVYVDATFGGGGHSRAILQQLDKEGVLVGFDQDEDALANVPDDERFLFVQSNFEYLKRFLKLHNIKQVDGILADLGVSSHQLDKAERGFSYRFEATLDMRMDQQAALTAQEVLNTYTAEDLQRILGAYGEVRNAKTLAIRLVEARHLKPFRTIGDLLYVVEPLVRGSRLKYLGQVFQAIRIEVNQELEVLKSFLEQSLEVLKPGGRLVIMSYHSLEDRPVKNFLKSGNFEGDYDKDFYGNIYRPFKLISKKAILPTKEECQRNTRARSAKLRVAEKMT